MMGKIKTSIKLLFEVEDPDSFEVLQLKIAAKKIDDSS